MISFLLEQTENRLGIQPAEEEHCRGRVRAIRSELVSKFFALPIDDPERERLKLDAAAADLALELLSYPDTYLVPDQVTDTRIVETIQRMQEFHYGKADVSIPLHVVIQFGRAIPVPAEKSPRNVEDPIMTELRDSLSVMIEALTHEARPLSRT